MVETYVYAFFFQVFSVKNSSNAWRCICDADVDVTDVESVMRRGFTPLQLLVTLAVISALLALLIPAIQQARVAARQTQCRQHLRQIGLALHGYHETEGCLPPLTTPAEGSEHHWDWRGFGPHARLLPYLDQAALYARLDFDRWALDGHANDLAAQHRVAASRCPSDADPSPHPGVNYALCTGTNIGFQNDGHYLSDADQNGICTVTVCVRLLDILDGASQVIAAAEQVATGTGTPLSDLAAYRYAPGGIPAGMPAAFPAAEQIRSWPYACALQSARSMRVGRHWHRGCRDRLRSILSCRPILFSRTAPAIALTVVTVMGRGCLRLAASIPVWFMF